MISINQRVVVHNFEVGGFLEDWNGTTGIVKTIRDGKGYIDVDGYFALIGHGVLAIGFPEKCLLPIKGPLASLSRCCFSFMGK